MLDRIRLSGNNISQRLSEASRFSRRAITVWKPLSQEEHSKLPHRLVRHRSHSFPEDTRLSLCHCEMWPLLLLGIAVTRVGASWWWDMKYGPCLRLTSLRFMAAQIHLPQNLEHGKCLEQSSELSFSTCEMGVMTVLTSGLSWAFEQDARSINLRIAFDIKKSSVKASFLIKKKCWNLFLFLWKFLD